MKLKDLLIAFAILAIALPLSAQKKISRLAEKDREMLHQYEDTLAVLGYAVVNDSLPDTRFLACREMIVRLKQALKAPGSFDYAFERLQSISIQYPQDSSFRIFSWQLYVDKDEYRYFGAIQLNTPDLQLIPLQDRSFQLEVDPEQAVLGPNDWYGALYYNIKAFDTPDGPYYLLFGFDGYKFFYKRKVVDVLRIRDGQVTFGAPVFHHTAGRETPELSKKRVVLEYSAAATVKLNYDPTYEMVMFDHLIAGGGQYGEGITYYPDGSYEGYQLQNGRWEYVEKIFNQVSTEAPREFPVLDKRSKNIFGKKSGNR